MVIPCLCSFSACIRGEIVRVLYRPPRKKSPDQRSGDSWWSIVHGTRTQHFLTGDRFGIIREVDIEYDPVIKDVDRVDKRRTQAVPPRGPRAGTRTRPSRLLRPSCPKPC